MTELRKIHKIKEYVQRYTTRDIKIKILMFLDILISNENPNDNSMIISTKMDIVERFTASQILSKKEYRVFNNAVTLSGLYLMVSMRMKRASVKDDLLDIIYSMYQKYSKSAVVLRLSLSTAKKYIAFEEAMNINHIKILSDDYCNS